MRTGLRGVVAFGGRHAALVAFACYLLSSFCLLGLPVLTTSGPQLIGGDKTDPPIFVWMFAWWPHAILHGQNPFVSHAVFAPDGVNMTWVTSAPALALVFAPATVLFGPVAAYNAAAVVMPAFAAFTAFLLCRYLTRDFWASLVGGYLFGFSSYMFAHTGGGQLHLTAVALAPLIALVLLRFLDGAMTNRGLVVRLGPLFALELLISTEVTLTTAMAMVVALALCFALVPERRRRIKGVVRPLVESALVAALLAAPLLYYVLSDFHREKYFQPESYVAELLNFFVPAGAALVAGGLSGAVSRLSHAYRTAPEAYIGVPALLVVVLYARDRLRTAAGRFLLVSLLVALVAAMGAYARLAGHRIVFLPWLPMEHLPGFNNILPVRFAAYASLVVAVIVALWTANRPGALRWVLPALALLAILPSLEAARWTTTYHIQRFFTDAAYRSCLKRGETILALPIGQGEAMLWQAVTDFRFNIAGGYVGPYMPPSFLRQKGNYYISVGNHLEAAQTGYVRSFAAEKGVTSVVVDGDEASFFSGALDPLASGQQTGGVVLYRLSGSGAPCPGS